MTAIVALAVATLRGLGEGAAVLLGSAWSLVNLRLIEGIVRAQGPHLVPGPRALLLLFLKLPVLYVAGWALLASGLSPLALAVGFSLVFAVLVAKALGLWLVHPEWRQAVRLERCARPRAGVAPRAGAKTAAWAIVGLCLMGGVANAWAQSTQHAPTSRHEASAATQEEPGSAAAGEHGAAVEAEQGAAAEAEHGAVAEGEHSAAEGEHGGSAHEEEGGAPELPNLITFLRAAYAGRPVPAWVEFLHRWENVFFSLLAAVGLSILLGRAGRRKLLVPNRAQNAAEWLVGGIHDFVVGLLGPDGRRYVPFVGTLFLYIVTMNWMALIPGLKSPTSSLNTTVALAICVFLYVQYIGITRLGIGGYLYHFAGQPKDIVGWSTAIILFPLEIMGELIKPISLSCRLFGNILGEDILIAVFVGLGLLVLSFAHSPVGIPLQLPFMFLSLLMSVIQGLVFALLSTIYILMMLPHHEGDEHHGEVPVTPHPVS